MTPLKTKDGILIIEMPSLDHLIIRKKTMKHKKVVEQWYEVSFDAYHRTLGPKIDEFLKGSPELDGDDDRANELWHENHTVLRDYEGDFEGIEIYSNNITKPLIEFMCHQLGVKFVDVGGLNFKLIN